MNRITEKAAILSLSLMLVSTYSISAILPAMLGYYSEFSRSQVDILISVPSSAIMIMVIANTWLSRHIHERLMISGGLLLLAFNGIAPLFLQSYAFVLATRILMGFGIGLVNTKAVSMISERFEGKERTALLGCRSSAETLGNAVLTFAAGRLLLLHWTYVFIIYAFAFLILALFLLFVPYRNAALPARPTAGARQIVKFSRCQILMTVFYAVSAGCLICTSSSISLRIPLLVLEKGYANESQASAMLSLFLLVGMISGVLYGKLTALAPKRLFLYSALACGGGMLVMSSAESLYVLGIGAVVSGLAHTVAMTCIFNGLPSHLPKDLVHAATSMVLVGCNLGASLAPFLTGIAERLRPGAATALYVCCGLLLAIGTVNAALGKYRPETAL